MLLAKNPQICFDNPMRAGEVSNRAHAAGPCPALTNDLRSTVRNRVKHTGRPLPGQVETLDNPQQSTINSQLFL